ARRLRWDLVQGGDPVFKNFSLVFSALGLTVALGSGCASKNNDTSSDPSAVDEGSDANQSESDTESMATSFIGGDGHGGRLATGHELSPMMGGELQLDNVGDAAKAFYKPAGCLVVTDDTANLKATYKFADCTGPYGLVHITGEVDVTYSSSAANQLTVNF